MGFSLSIQIPFPHVWRKQVCNNCYCFRSHNVWPFDLTFPSEMVTKRRIKPSPYSASYLWCAYDCPRLWHIESILLSFSSFVIRDEGVLKPFIRLVTPLVGSGRGLRWANISSFTFLQFHRRRLTAVCSRAGAGSEEGIWRVLQL